MDLDSKYDRAQAPTPLNESEAQDILKPFLNGRSMAFFRPLSGGYLNSNFEFGLDGTNYVLRISNRGEAALATEVSILKNLDKEIPAPRVVYFHPQQAETRKLPFAVLSYLPGMPLCLAEDEFNPEDIRRVGSEIGEVLARIHVKTFSSSGDFDSGFTIQDGMDDFRVAIQYETNRCLQSPKLKARIDENLWQELARFIGENAFLLDSLVQARLTHSDFNQKNILVDRVDGNWKVTGIIDWEYAFSGPCLYDFGNFFRFESEMPRYRDHLVRAYKRCGGFLPENWEQVAKYLDLLPQLQFLARNAETPKTFATAKSVIRATVKR